MQIDVIVLLRGAIQEIDFWRHEMDKDGRLFTRDRDGNRLPPLNAWQRLALDINRQACDSSHLPVDVFLILRGQLSENLYYADTLAQVASYAREHARGGNAYVVWDQGATFDSLYRGNDAVLKKWFLAPVQSGITDVIEIKQKKQVDGTGREENIV